ncbi:MAG: hypothetical protein ACKVOR_03860 [Flavobacteriales bacterium]
MKKFILSLSLLSCAVASIAQEDSTGLAGDHFSLQGALELFSKATSIEDFEKALNTEANHVNNLDMNEDGEIDYVRVEDHADGDAHAFALQVAVNENESQDVAAIEIEKTGEATAQGQIVGDEELYGEGIYVEALDEKAEGGKGGPSAAIETRIMVVNVWLWPSVRFVYAPAYRPWVSPWHWRAYPAWWKPWRPFGWRAHHGYCGHYRSHFHVVHLHRCSKAHAVYRTHRAHSATVHGHYKDAHLKHRERKAIKTHDANKANTKNEKAGKVNKAEKTQKQPKKDPKAGKSSKQEKANGVEKPAKKSGGAKPAKASGRGGKK